MKTIRAKIAKPPMAAATVSKEPDEEGVFVESLMVREAFGDARIADRDELGLGEALQIGPEEYAAHANDRGGGPEKVEGQERQRVAMAVVGLEGGSDVVDQVDDY